MHLKNIKGYNFNTLILLFLGRYFGVFDSDLRASPPICLIIECLLGLLDYLVLQSHVIVVIVCVSCHIYQ